MSDSGFQPEDEILLEFMRQLEAAKSDNEVEALLKKSSEDHPARVEMFRVLADAKRLAAHAEPSAESQPQTRAMPRELGEFLILRLIKRSGMGEVHEAYHDRLDRRVAIKTIRRDWEKPGARQRFDREQRVLARLHQTNIIPIHTAGEQDGLLYFAMPLIEGASLDGVVNAAREHLTTRAGLSTPSAAGFAEAVVYRMKTDATGDIRQRPAEEQASGPGMSSTFIPEPADSAVQIQTVQSGTQATAGEPAPIDYEPVYHLSVVRAMADAAQAVHYAHEAGVLHRDLKPHNIMIQPDGHVWVIDFGLAGYLKSRRKVSSSESATAETELSFDSEPALTRYAGMGTPGYVAPEKFQGASPSPRSDVWALGATLYELLTLRKAYDGQSMDEYRKQVSTKVTRPCAHLVRNLPVELDAICRRAMDPDPLQRYESAADLADDLRRTLNHEPPSVLPWSSRRRAILWYLRNPQRAWLGATVLALLVVAFGLMAWANAAYRAVNNANQKMIVANTAALEASRKALERKERDEAIRAIERLYAGPHGGPYPNNHDERSWSEIIQGEARAVPRLEGDHDLRNAVATSLIDPDASIVYDDETTDTEFLAFDPTGEHLLTGGAPKIEVDRALTVAQPPRILHVSTKTWRDSTIDGFGPVAFRGDGVPVVLVVDRTNIRQFRLFDVNTSQPIASWTLDDPSESLAQEHSEPRPSESRPSGSAAVPVTVQKDTRSLTVAARESQSDSGTSSSADRLTELNRPIIALSPDARWAVIGTRSVSATHEHPAVDSEITVWDVATSQRIHQCRVSSAGSVAISPDGRFLAIGTSTGTIMLWQIGSIQPFAELTNKRAEILSLAFGKDYRRPLPSPKDLVPGAGWLLATGDSAGGIVIWDLRNRIPRTEPRGAEYQTLSLLFSPDSSQLFSCGRSLGHIWDVATGEEFLNWRQRVYMPALRLGAGGQFASAGSAVHVFHPGLRIQRLVTDRGGRVLRGLREIPQRLATSHDGSLIAALTIQFEVGVWRTDGTLLHVFEAPLGPFADNATISISPDNKEVFCCNGDRAFTWNLQTAVVQRTWDVAPALCNESAWSPDGKHLWFARRELVDCHEYPWAGEGEQIVRTYDLLSPEGSDKPILELDGPGRRCYGINIGTNGLLVLTGFTGTSPKTSTGECWDLTMRTRLWSQRWNDEREHAYFLTPDGSLVSRSVSFPSRHNELVDPRSENVIITPFQSWRPSTDSRWGMRVGGNDQIFDNESRVHLHRANNPTPLVTFSHEASRVWDATFFETQGHSCLAWSNNKGHVVVADIDEIQHRLEAIDLAWPDTPE